MRTATPIWLAIACVGCIDLIPGPPEDLIDVTRFVRVVGEDDVFTGQGGSDDLCEGSGVLFTDFGGQLSMDVTTDQCPRATVQQTTLHDIGEGDLVALNAWHDQLTAPEPAEAVLALALGGEEVWRAELPIPQDPGAVVGEFTATQDWPRGTPLQWHVHNHGNNSYHLFAVVVRPLVPASEVVE